MIMTHSTKTRFFGIRRLIAALLILAGLLSVGCGDFVFIGNDSSNSGDSSNTDFEIQGLELSISKEGKPVQDVHSSSALLRFGEGVIELKDVKVFIYDDNQEVNGTLVADQGVLYVTDRIERSKNDVDLLGNVHYESRDGSFFDTQQVYYFEYRSEIWASTPVKQGRVMDNQMVLIEGSEMRSDRYFRKVRTKNPTMIITPIENVSEAPTIQ